MESESTLSRRKMPPPVPVVSRFTLYLQEPFYITEQSTLYFQTVSVPQIS